MGWYEDWVQYQKNVATAQAVASGNAAGAAAINPEAAKYITASVPAAQTAQATTEAVARGDAAAAAALSPDAAKYIGESASYIARGGAEEEKPSSTIGSVLKTVATIAVPVVAAIAAPFLAPIAAAGLAAVGLGTAGAALGLGTAALGGVTALGTGLTGAATGAGLGAATGALTGRGAGMGAITGGLGGGLLGYANVGGALTGLAPAVANAPLQLPGAAAITPVGGALFGGSPTGLGLGATAGGALATSAPFLSEGLGGVASTLGLAGAGTAAAGAASPILSNVIGGLVGKFAEGITAGGLTDLAMTMYNKPVEGLTEEERRTVTETAGLARTNQNLFKQRVEQANAIWNAAAADPERAYAEAVSGVQRGVREAQRQYGTGQYGGTGSGRRQAGLARAGAIEAQRAGAAAVAGETSRAEKDMIAAAGLTPTSAPIGEAAATLPLYQAAEKRKQQYQEQLARSVGGLFGGVYNRNRSPQFSINYGQ